VQVVWIPHITCDMCSCVYYMTSVCYQHGSFNSVYSYGSEIFYLKNAYHYYLLEQYKGKVHYLVVACFSSENSKFIARAGGSLPLSIISSTATIYRGVVSYIGLFFLLLYWYSLQFANLAWLGTRIVDLHHVITEDQYAI